MNFTDELRRHLEKGVVRVERRRSRERRLVAAAVGVAVVGLVMVIGASVLGDDSPNQIATDQTVPTSVVESEPTATRPSGPDSEAGLPVPETSRLQEAPEGYSGVGLVGSVMAWMDGDLFVWGGTVGFGSGTVADVDGALYNPVSDTWRPLPAVPGGPQAEAVGAWTGSEVVICCGNNTDFGAGTAIAYNPATDTWRELPPPPLLERTGGPAAVWADERFFVIASREMVAYSPATDTWEVLSPPPIELSVSPAASVVAADGQLVVWPRPSARSSRSGLVYDLAGDSWSELPAPPREAWPAVADIAWTGSELIVVGGLPGAFGGDSERLVGSRLDWSTKEWTPLPDVWPEPIPSEGNLGSQAILWTGDLLLVASGGMGSGVDPLDGVIATYDPATDEWRQLPSLDGVTIWRPPLIQIADGRVFTIAGGYLQGIDPSAETSEAIDSSGLRAVNTPPFEDIRPTNTALTLVGTNGNGADIVVLDLELGLRTVYLAGQHHQLGQGGLTDLAVGDDRSLYIWRTDQPTIRYRGGPAPWDEGDRLTFGELAQPGEIIETGGPERFVLPIPSSTDLWIWEARGDQRVARQINHGQPNDNPIEAVFDADFGPQGVAADGSLVVATDTTVSSVKLDGRVFNHGTGTVVAIAGNEVLLQQCDEQECSRHWADLSTGRTRNGSSSEWSWAAPAGPIIPGHSAALPTESPGGDQILILATPVSATSDSSSLELRRVDVQTLNHEDVQVPPDISPVLATWSRDGRSVVVVSGNDIAAVDLTTGRASSHKSLIPDGFFVLAAG